VGATDEDADDDVRGGVESNCTIIPAVEDDEDGAISRVK
jgi:hypothetical protein